MMDLPFPVRVFQLIFLIRGLFKLYADWEDIVSIVDLETAKINENYEYYPPFVEYMHIHQNKVVCEGYGSIISEHHILTDNHCYGRYFLDDSYFVVNFTKFYPKEFGNFSRCHRVNILKNYRQLLIFEFDHSFDFEFHPISLFKNVSEDTQKKLSSEYFSFKVDHSENVVNRKKNKYKFGSPIAVKIRNPRNNLPQWLQAAVVTNIHAVNDSQRMMFTEFVAFAQLYKKPNFEQIIDCNYIKTSEYCPWIEQVTNLEVICIDFDESISEKFQKLHETSYFYSWYAGEADKRFAKFRFYSYFILIVFNIYKLIKMSNDFFRDL